MSITNYWYLSHKNQISKADGFQFADNFYKFEIN